MSYRVLFHVGPCFPGTPHMNQNPFRRWTIMIAQPQPLIEVFAEIPDFAARGANAIPCPPSSHWPVVRCCVAIAALAPSPHGGAMTAAVSPRRWALRTPPVRRRCTRCFDMWIATPWKRHWAPGLRGASAAPPPPHRRVKPPWPSMAQAAGLPPARRSWGPPAVGSVPPLGPHPGPTGGGREDQ